MATPILHYSLVFTEQELIETERSQRKAWQEAVARRETVSAPVPDTLVEVGKEDAAALDAFERARIINPHVRRPRPW